MFLTCSQPDTGSPEYCAGVVQSQVEPSDSDLCQNFETRNQCEFSCCVYYFASDEQPPKTPEPLDPENCKNLEDEKSYHQCFMDYLENQCDPGHECRRTCFLLGNVGVPVNPGCYDGDDKGKKAFCLTKCQSKDDCKNDECQNKYAFSCCVLSTDPDEGTTTSPATLDSTSSTPCTTSNAAFTTDSECSSLTDDATYTLCLERLKSDATNCVPSGAMFDTERCNQQCCIIGATLISTTTSEDSTTPPGTTPNTDTTTDEDTTPDADICSKSNNLGVSQSNSHGVGICISKLSCAPGAGGVNSHPVFYFSLPQTRERLTMGMSFHKEGECRSIPAKPTYIKKEKDIPRLPEI